jgi:hypothetical protein
MANGVEDVVPNQPFRIRMINTSLREGKLSKGMIVGHALAHPKGIVAMVDVTSSTAKRGVVKSPNWAKKEG